MDMMVLTQKMLRSTALMLANFPLLQIDTALWRLFSKCCKVSRDILSFKICNFSF